MLLPTMMGLHCGCWEAAEMRLQPAEVQQPTWRGLAEQEEQAVPIGLMILPGACLKRKCHMFEL